ncbi:uncharacterized protein FPOAC1_013302 [Fusarium poae]|uniref:uncharacterized protein n=1 Tax=Fusarium poae TaxID=36050 RepID=UPI001D0504BC|nr:uncharacterized protein FPOAC1_012851 [Fusarium poae]XP_044701826.1 uncharacterized protein FPOAC1_013302 [Fusarium poae]KAG8664874.1 hypothetical protein FPOAC1_012851 [Fusarium poae]KAG8665323.1 hypothetical protein FPOAC1_013302 [Fusarium poae]
MILPCLSSLFSRLPHLINNNNEGTSWTNRYHSVQERTKVALRHKKISLQVLRRHRQQPPQGPPQSHDRNSLASKQNLSTLHTTRYTPGCTPVPLAVPARSHYIDRACQTDLCRISLLSTDDLVFEMLLDECRIPNGRSPPPYDPQDGF